MKKNRLFLGLGTLSFAFVPVVLATSCQDNIKYISPSTVDTSNQYASTDIGGVASNFGDGTLTSVENEAKKIKESGTEKQKALIENQPIIQITTAGKVTDNSFNQMTWEAISKFSKTVGIKTSTYTETKTTSDSEMFNAYNNALNKGYKIWVLTGWSHESPFSKWMKTGKNRERFEKNEIKIVSIDWNSSQYVPKGRSLSLNFKTQEATFLIGYSVSKFLATKYKGDDNKNKRIVNATAGADGSGSTNFIYGFLEGVRQWNDEQNDNTTKVSTNVYTDTRKVFLNTTYEENNPSTRADFELSVKGNGDQIFKGAAPTVVMPVAGDWSRTAANIIKDTKSNQWVVGVDSNMAISYGSEYSKYFITSAEKRISIATFKSLSFLTGITQSIENNEKLLLDNDGNWKIDENGFISNSSSVDNLSINGGIDSDLVGASESTIENTTDASDFNKIISETKTKFFGESGELNKNVDQGKLEAFKKAQQNPGIDNKNYNEAVFNLKNVLYGEMSTNNNGFFNMIVDDINKWNK